MYLSEEMKTCTKCKRDFPANTYYFHVNNAVKCGLQARCKECRGASFGETPKRERQRSLEDVVDGKIECLHCNRWLPLDENHFFRQGSSSIGFDLKCKECKGREFSSFQGKVEFKVINNIEFRKCTKCNEFKENTSDNFRLMSHDTGKLNPKCKKCEYDYAENPEGYKERSKRYNRSEKGKDLRRRYKKTDKYRILNRQAEQRRRSRKNSLLSDLTVREWNETLIHWTDDLGNILCAYCSEVVNNPDQEHIIPISHGGEYTKNNIIPVGGVKECSCNQKKNNRTLEEYYNIADNFSEVNYLKIQKFIEINSK